MLLHRLAGTECAPSGRFRQTMLSCPARIRAATPATALVPTLCGCQDSTWWPIALSCNEVDGNSSTTSANPLAAVRPEAPSPRREVPEAGSLLAFCLRERDRVGRGSRVPGVTAWGGAAGTAASPPPLQRADRGSSPEPDDWLGGSPTAEWSCICGDGSPPARLTTCS